MPSLPITRVKYGRNLVQALREMGVPVEETLARSDLPEHLLQNDEDWLPADLLTRFLAIATRESGASDVCLRAGYQPFENLGPFGRNILLQGTLLEAIETFCTMAPLESTRAEFSLDTVDGYTWFRGGKIGSPREEILPIEMYHYGLFLRLVRYAAGPNWLPQHLELQSTEKRRLEAIPEIDGCTTKFGCHMLAFDIPDALLDRPLRFAPGVSLDDRQSTRPRRTAPQATLSFESTVREVTRTHVRCRSASIRDVAASIGMSVRTFQRRLEEAGLVYSRILEEARSDIATSMLQNPDIRIIQVSLEAGYNDAAHFTRAFKRNHGMTPSEYREQHHRLQ